MSGQSGHALVVLGREHVAAEQALVRHDQVAGAQDVERQGPELGMGRRDEPDVGRQPAPYAGQLLARGRWHHTGQRRHHLIVRRTIRG